MAKNRILVAEDEQPLSHAMSLKLGSEGFDVTIANDGKEAIEELKGGSFDMLLLDLIMPGADGFEVLEFLKKEGIRIPTIVLSNLGQSEDVERAKSYGAKDYFVKADTPLSTIVAQVKEKLSS